MKRCSKCKQWKVESEFNKKKRNKDGLRYECRKCQAEYYQDNKEREIKRQRKYDKIHKRERTEYRRKHIEEERIRHSNQRGLDYNPLNESFEGSVMHHINDTDVVFIPKKIHLKFNGNRYTTIEQHRNKILNYYGSLKRMINNNPIGGA